ncbi:hypothetical protein P9293_05530 [Bacillus inaquosorum]|uniref:hypothetical protein n=1 Tax=Bacillus TaxID=1386 RepID=UPI00031F1517|nr:MULTISPECIES: hypothetical protein [Bacillus]MED4646878.1 hypothetical protein [Bacillus inaquosorum]MED4791912.1 hypothetical protein [Bacillus inaquosorum]
MAAIEHIEMFCGSLFIYNCKYDFRQQAIIDKILKNEKAINERFNTGDYFGFLDCSIDDVTYVDRVFLA